MYNFGMLSAQNGLEHDHKVSGDTSIIQTNSIDYGNEQEPSDMVSAGSRIGNRAGFSEESG